MRADLREYDAGQLLEACACMESALVAFINKCGRQGIDTAELRDILDDVHAAVDGLREP